MTLKPRTLYIDIETYSSISINNGVYKYIEAPDFEILLLAYAFDDGPIKIIDFACHDKLPNNLIAAFTDSDIVKVAYNAIFERVCIAHSLGVATPPEQWECLMVKSLVFGLPKSLEMVCDALNISANQKKLSIGKALIKHFCAPTPTGKRVHPKDDPERWQQMIAYCVRDVEAARTVDKVLAEYPTPPEFERKLWIIDQYINELGVGVDVEMVGNVCAYYEHYKDKLLTQAQELSGINNPQSNAQAKRWLASRGFNIESLNQKTIAEIIETTNDQTVIDFLQLYVEIQRKSIEKYTALQNAVCSDGRIRGLLQFHGASTGRWTSYIVQLHNLPRNNMTTLDEARELVKANDFDVLELLYSAPVKVLSELIRTAFIPAAGHVYVIADFAAIEARIISWLAGETWRNEVFATHGKIYEASAAKMYRIPLKDVTPELRTKGKIAELALGYGGGVGALKRMGADVFLTNHEMQELVYDWRATNPAIVDLWARMEEAAKMALDYPGMTLRPAPNKDVGFTMVKDTLFLKLPSGRRIAYKNARLALGEYGVEIQYDTLEQGRWVQVSTYGGKLTENCVQAIARDCLAVALSRLYKADYIPSFHVHDEVVVEVKTEKAERDKAAIELIMSQSIRWAPELVLKAEAFISEYYRKD